MPAVSISGTTSGSFLKERQISFESEPLGIPGKLAQLLGGEYSIMGIIRTKGCLLSILALNPVQIGQHETMGSALMPRSCTRSWKKRPASSSPYCVRRIPLPHYSPSSLTPALDCSRGGGHDEGELGLDDELLPDVPLGVHLGDTEALVELGQLDAHDQSVTWRHRAVGLSRKDLRCMKR